MKLQAKLSAENQLSVALGSDRQIVQILNTTNLKPEQFNSLFFKLCEDPAFISWATNFSQGNPSSLCLTQIIFERVEFADPKVSAVTSNLYSRLYFSIVLEDTAKPEAASETETQKRKVFVQLENTTAAVLIIFRLNPPSAFTGTRNEKQTTSSPAPAGGIQSRPREFVLFVKKPQYPSGLKNFLQIPHGVVESRVFVGDDAQILKNVANLEPMSDYHLIEMTSFSGKKSQNHSKGGVSVAPQVLGGRLRLYLYRETIGLEEVERLQRLSAKSTCSHGIELCSLNEAWWKTSDTVSLSSLFLFHELRYHNLMPKYKPPRELKKYPTYMNVTELDPNGHGYNLRVRVSSIPERANTTTHSAMYDFIVGDSTGCVVLRLSAEQRQENSSFLTPGSSIFLRNVDIDMTGSRIAILINRFGKLNVSEEPFDFEVNQKNNISSLEYEEVTGSDVSQKRNSNTRFPRSRRLRRQMIDEDRDGVAY